MLPLATVRPEPVPPRLARRERLAWAGPATAAAVGAALRFWELGRPHALVFDEQYYVRDALSLITFGVERKAVEGAGAILLAGGSPAEVFLAEPSFVAHPPLGKWLIGAGQAGFGSNPFGWRFAAATASVVSIVLLGRIVYRLTGNSLLATLAAGLLALDGLHLVMGRVALLDGFLMLFVLAAFGALLIDRDHTRAARLRLPPGGRLAGLRWWRITAGVLLGLACAVKWSGLWYVAVFGMLSVAWDVGSRRAGGADRPLRVAILRDAVPAFLALVVLAGAVYLFAWTGWLLSPDGWGRQAADGPSYVPQPLRALAGYHGAVYRFHVGLGAEHPYQSPAWGWLVQARPTTFYYDGDVAGCGSQRCVSAITALGNPVIWWAAVLALGHHTFRAVLVRDRRSAALVLAVLAGWVPWLFYPERTMFGFYSLVFLPFLVAALTLSLGQILGTGPVEQRPWRIAALGCYLLAVIAAASWFLPIWTGTEIGYVDWARRMWLRASWI